LVGIAAMPWFSTRRSKFPRRLNRDKGSIEPLGYSASEGPLRFWLCENAATHNGNRTILFAAALDTDDDGDGIQRWQYVRCTRESCRPIASAPAALGQQLPCRLRIFEKIYSRSTSILSKEDAISPVFRTKNKNASTYRSLTKKDSATVVRKLHLKKSTNRGGSF
jgi:hypothetical protein